MYYVVIMQLDVILCGVYFFPINLLVFEISEERKFFVVPPPSKFYTEQVSSGCKYMAAWKVSIRVYTALG
jgi:hypothetical protein